MDYNPHKLPERIDFHKATKEFPISRESKTKLQIALSKMSRKKIRETIKTLREMAYYCLGEELKWKDWENIDKKLTAKNYKELPGKMKDDFRMAIWCKFCVEFAEKYLESLDKQKKV